MQEFISLLHQKDDSIAAIHYARKNLVKFIQSAQEEQGHTEETQALLRKQINKVFQAMGLFAYQKTQREQNPYYIKLTKSGRWSDLADAFENEAFKLYGLSD